MKVVQEEKEYAVIDSVQEASTNLEMPATKQSLEAGMCLKRMFDRWHIAKRLTNVEYMFVLRCLTDEDEKADIALEVVNNPTIEEVSKGESVSASGELVAELVQAGSHNPEGRHKSSGGIERHGSGGKPKSQGGTANYYAEVRRFKDKILTALDLCNWLYTTGAPYKFQRHVIYLFKGFWRKLKKDDCIRIYIQTYLARCHQPCERLACLATLATPWMGKDPDFLEQFSVWADSSLEAVVGVMCTIDVQL
jgi:hypothetical protein